MDHTFAALLREERRAAGLTQEELAHRSGVAQRTISDLERGKFPSPRVQTVRLLAGGLGLSGPRRERLEHAARGLPTGPDPAAVFSRVRIPPTPLIGREADTARVADLLTAGTSRIVTLTGPGGVGKTRLAAAAAAAAATAFPDGVRDVDLVPLRDADDLLRAIAHRLTAPGGGEVADAADLAARLGGDRLLLVLDNMEHLVDHADPLTALVSGCPNLSVLVTSRVPLRVRGEQEYAVAPLPVPGPEEVAGPGAAVGVGGAGGAAGAGTPLPASVELFTLHAARRRYGWRPTAADLRHVGAICRALDGLPLAIELAAERIGSLDPASIVDALASASGALGLLADGPRDLPDRQRSMAASVRWSYEQLPEAGRTLLRSLAIFPARWRWEALAAVGGPQAPVAVAELVDSHLVQIQEGPNGLTYRLSQPVREFAAEQLEQHAETATVSRLLTDYAVELADRAEPHLTGPDQAAWLDRLDDEHDTLRAVLARLVEDGGAEQAIRLSGALWRFWYARGHIRGGRAWLRRALTALDADPSRADPPAAADAVRLARALNGLASLESCLEETAGVPGLYKRAIALWERAGDTAGSSASRTNLGMYEHFYGSPEAARDLYRQAADDARTGGHDRPLGAALVNLGQLLTGIGETEAAEASLDEALEAFRRHGDLRAQADTLGCLAELALTRSRPRQARRHAASARRLFTALNDELGVTQTWEVTARCEAAEGDYAAADERLGKVLARYEELEYPWGAAEAVTARARFAAAGGDPDLAYVLATDAVRRWEGIEDAGDAGQEARDLLTALDDGP
ncbi:ATP-binding protein [Catenulispora subtropica]|uniref:HTH cro/C1-type domain-containing protein n=1 Tax=Catenulispora subtropica TaxID=450798 RepID=A0ABN2S5B5_9ACTN